MTPAGIDSAIHSREDLQQCISTVQSDVPAKPVQCNEDVWFGVFFYNFTSNIDSVKLHWPKNSILPSPVLSIPTGKYFHYLKETTLFGFHLLFGRTFLPANDHGSGQAFPANLAFPNCQTPPLVKPFDALMGVRSLFILQDKLTLKTLWKQNIPFFPFTSAKQILFLGGKNLRVLFS